VSRVPLPCVPVDLATLRCRTFDLVHPPQRETYRKRSRFVEVKPKGRAPVSYSLAPATPAAPALDLRPIEQLMALRNAAIEVWLVEILSTHGVAREEIAARCVLVTKESPRLIGAPWVDEMHVEIDGARVGPSLRLFTQQTTEAP
jgi:hypothetical protein